MNANLIILPVLIPMLSAILGLVRPASHRYQKTVGMVGMVLLFLASVWLTVSVVREEIMVLRVGGWSAPWGIVLVADRLSAAMTLVAALISLCTVGYAVSSVTESETKTYFFPLMHLLMMGVNGSFLTGDLFNLYVCFEVMLIASFVLMVHQGSPLQLEAGLKYVTINVLSSMILLAGIGMLYGKLGTLNMVDIARILQSTDESVLVNTTVVLLVIAFGIKSAIFPLFFWLPASYHTLPVPVVALFAGLLTKVGIYSYLRSFTLLFGHSTDVFGTILLWLGAATMVTGVLGAASQYHVRRILSFHIVSQIGYILFAMALFSEYAIAAAVFYTIHHIIVKSNLFLVSGLISNHFGSGDLKQMGGLYRKAPLLALLFSIPALSLGGIPPLSGFWAKLSVIKAALDKDVVWIAIVAALVGVLTLYSMTKNWVEAFWKAPVDSGDAPGEMQLIGCDAVKGRKLVWWPSLLLAVLTVMIGIFPQVLFDYAELTARQLLDTSFYINAVLGSP